MRHPDEKELLKFLDRPDQSAAYVAATAEWIKANYPESVGFLIPRLREIYRKKPKAP
jgi:hypothetical protein